MMLLSLSSLKNSGDSKDGGEIENFFPLILVKSLKYDSFNN